ncbi:MAG TPA: Yip1 family protein [Xanthobacteraceae bacterium]|jgi:hypothetical protein|nr:Yip1 family protein [Xanthobacteraceae bacterium]
MNLVERAIAMADRVFKRVKGIIVQPRAEWQIIDGEASAPVDLYRGYIAILAAVPAICDFIGECISGPSVLNALKSGVVRYVLALLIIYAIAWIIDMLAPTFGGRKDFPSALKLAVYSYTPWWVAGIFLLLPGLRFLNLLGLYGVYVFWLGLPVLMQCKPEKTLDYLSSVVGGAIVVMLVLGFVLATVGLPILL